MNNNNRRPTIRYKILQETADIIGDNYDSDLLKRCYFIGYGPAQIAATMSGLANDADEVRETSYFLGYAKTNVELE